MTAPPASQAMLQFVDDEMLRAPLLFDQLIEGVLEHARKTTPGLGPLQRAVAADLVQTLPNYQSSLLDYFMHSLREQVSAELDRGESKVASRRKTPQALALVDDEEVALDVELSHVIDAIKGVAEYELRELQTFTAALVGDMDMARDHNPFRAETYARALWSASQALPVSRGLQVSLMRHASEPLSQLLRRSYAASSSRLESMGIEPAAYRTVVLPSGSRRNRRPEASSGASSHSQSPQYPDLGLMRRTMPAPLEEPSDRTRGERLSGAAALLLQPVAGIAPTPPAASSVPQRHVPAAPPAARQPSEASGALRESWRDLARSTPTNRADRQAIELVSRLFDAISLDERVPRDVAVLISRLHGPAMRLALRDATLLDKGEHPLWRFVNRLAFAAEMSPDKLDPERYQLLKVAQGTIDQLASEQEQNTGLYRWAVERLETHLTKKLQRRVTMLASQTGALQKLEDRLQSDGGPPSTMHGTLDLPQLDTVPAMLLDDDRHAARNADQAEAWVTQLRAGEWLRVFLQGRWVQAQLLWMGERRDVWLIGDGASDATWAIRRSALLTLYARGLMKTLIQRSVVASAAARVQEQVTAGGTPD